MSLRDSYDEELLQPDDDEDMESLLASVRRKKPRLKYPRRDDRELSTELTSERTERTPLLKSKTSLRPRQRSRSTSLSPTIAEKKMELGRTASNDFYTPKRQSLSLAGHSRSGEISVLNSNRQHRASRSGPSPKAPLKEPSLPSTAAASESDPLSLAPRHHNKEIVPPRALEDDSSEYSSDEGEGTSRKPTDSEEKSKLSQALKDMTNVLNVLVKRVENNSNEIHALKTTLQNSNTPSSSSESSSGSRKQKVPAVVRVCDYVHAHDIVVWVLLVQYCAHLTKICYLLPQLLW